jgi:uncharacterized repeat protein (TIGR01451 family)
VCLLFQVPAKKRLRTVISLKLCRTILVRLLAVLVIISSFLIPPAFSQDSADSQIFISGFNAYQQKDYATTISRMKEVLEKYPDSPLRDMVLFWLSRACYKSGNQQDAAKYLSQFNREFPDNPLKGTVDEELLALTARYEKGEQLPGGSQPLVAKKEPVEREQSAAAKREKERLAAVKADEARTAAEQAEQQRIALQKGEQERLAAAQREQERQAAVRAEDARKAAESSERERLAAARREQERLAAAEPKAEVEKVDMELVARQQAEMVRQTQAKAEQKRQAALKAEEEREAAARAAKAEQKRLAAVKADQENSAAAVEEKRLAALKAEEDRLAAEKAGRVRAEREKAEAERLALEKSAADARAAEEAKLQIQAALKAEQERTAAQAAEKERRAVAVAAVSTAAPTAPAAPAAREQKQKRDAAAKTALREKAIAQYKSVLEKYPNSKAAATAAAKLKALGVVVAGPSQPAAEAPLPENSQVLQLEVAQFAGLELNLSTPARPFNVAQRVSIPLEIINQGNGSDSFYLESGFPAEFGAGFAASATPDQPVNQTTQLAPGESFRGFLNLTIPAGRIDGQRIMHPIRATSRSFTDAAQTREVRLIAAAPLLRAVVKADRTQPLPGDRITYRVTVLNVGSIAAQDVSLRLSFPPQLDPVDSAASGFRQEMKSALVLDGLQIKSGESREYLLAFQLKDDSLAGQELLTRAELFDNPLKTSAAFVSNAAYVQQKRGMQVRAASERLVIIPGQTVNVPFVVTNTGNAREKFKIVSSVTGNRETVVFQDLNRDGIRQPSDPVITEIGPLAPKEEAGIVMEIRTPRSAADGSEDSARISFASEGDETRSYDAATRLLYSRPALQLVMTGRDGRLKPGEVATFDLTISNRGSNLAQVVELQSSLPEQLELLAAEPAAAGSGKGIVTWRFKELGAGEKRTIKVSFRVRAGTVMGTNIQVKNTLIYEDQLGNRY